MSKKSRSNGSWTSEDGKGRQSGDPQPERPRAPSPRLRLSLSSCPRLCPSPSPRPSRTHLGHAPTPLHDVTSRPPLNPPSHGPHVPPRHPNSWTRGSPWGARPRRPPPAPPETEGHALKRGAGGEGSASGNRGASPGPAGPPTAASFSSRVRVPFCSLWGKSLEQAGDPVCRQRWAARDFPSTSPPASLVLRSFRGNSVRTLGGLRGAAARSPRTTALFPAEFDSAPPRAPVCAPAVSVGCSGGDEG